MNVNTWFLLLNLALLQFEGVSIEQYFRVGESMTFSCDWAKDPKPNCSRVDWDFVSASEKHNVVSKGRVLDSPRSSRMRLSSNCSLTIHSVTQDDVGMYQCAQFSPLKTVSTQKFFVNVLSAFLSPEDLYGDEAVVLQCTLWRLHMGYCRYVSFRWLDSKGMVLSGEGVSQRRCVSSAIVRRHSPVNRTFTCQYVEDDDVKVSVELSLQGGSDTGGSSGVVYAVVSVLVIVAVAAAVICKVMSKRNSSQNLQETDDTRDDVCQK